MSAFRFLCFSIAALAAIPALAADPKLPNVWHAYCLMTPMTGLSISTLQTPIDIHYGEEKTIFVIKNIDYTLSYGEDMGEPYVIEIKAIDRNTKQMNLANAFADKELPTRLDLEAHAPDVSITCFQN